MFERLSHYNILDRIGAGGMGDIYRARDTRHGRTVALHVLPASIRDDAGRREQFVRDAQRAAALSHPNIATLYETAEDEGQLFVAFEFVPGDALKSLLAAGPINPRRALQAAAQVADALAEGHARGIAHGAIDVDHVVITPKGIAKLLDFGMASWSSGSPSEPGSAPDPREDLPALGVLLQDMARGGPASGPRAATPEIDRIVARALCDDPDERYESAAMFAADLRATAAALDARAESISARAAVPDHLTSTPRSSIGRRAMVLVAAAAAAGAIWIGRDRLSSTWRRTLASAPRPVIAVMPFEQADGSRNYFSSGFADDVAARLGQMPGVQVVGRGRSRSGAGGSPKDLGRTLGAAVVLAGTVRSSREAVAVSVRVVEPSSGAELWRGEYAREPEATFPLQSQIALDVARSIGVNVSPSAATERAAARLVEPAAYDAYLRGREAAIDNRLTDMETWFTRAVQLDDGLAEAHAALAVTLYRIAARDASRGDDTLSRLRRAANRAFELTPDLPAANLAAALAADSLRDALTALKSAIRYDPSYADAYREIGDQIKDLDPDRAARFYRKALALDSTSGLDDHTDRAEWPDGSCEGVIQAVAADTSGRPSSNVRQRLVSAMERGTAPDAGPYAVRCAALSAAALGDGRTAGALLSRIASTEMALRAWATHTGGLTGSGALTGKTGPWPRVVDQPSFASGRNALDAAYERARRDIADTLGELLF